MVVNTFLHVSLPYGMNVIKIIYSFYCHDITEILLKVALNTIKQPTYILNQSLILLFNLKNLFYYQYLIYKPTVKIPITSIQVRKYSIITMCIILYWVYKSLFLLFDCNFKSIGTKSNCFTYDWATYLSHAIQKCYTYVDFLPVTC